MSGLMLSPYDAALALPPDSPEDDTPRCLHCGAVLTDEHAEFCSPDCAYSAGRQSVADAQRRPLRVLGDAIAVATAWTVDWPEALADERTRLRTLQRDAMHEGDETRCALAAAALQVVDTQVVVRGRTNTVLASRHLAIAASRLHL
jgi:hypothetical protein